MCTRCSLERGVQKRIVAASAHVRYRALSAVARGTRGVARGG